MEELSLDVQIKKACAILRQLNEKRDRAGRWVMALQRKRDEQAEEQLKEETGINVYRASDYCGMSCREYRFYYGYEATVCLFHGNDNHCDCDEVEWAFVAYGEEGELLRIPQSKLTTSQEPVLMNLLAGIGQFIDSMKGEE